MDRVGLDCGEHGGEREGWEEQHFVVVGQWEVEEADYAGYWEYMPVSLVLVVGSMRWEV